MKATLFTRHRSAVEPMMIVKDRKAIHQAIDNVAVNQAVTRLRRNVVLDDRPPSINISENELTRKERTTLAQLRSGHCRLLSSYKNRISKDASLDVCADCGKTPHDVKHLFNCPAHPTTMTPLFQRQQPTRGGNVRSSKPANCCQHISSNRFLDGCQDPSKFAAAKLAHYSSKPQQHSDSSRLWLRILLSGDVHPNPGPTTKYPYPVCASNVTGRRVSYLCNQCFGWVHSKCAGLQNAVEYRRIKDWVCSSCSSPPIHSTETTTATNINSNISC